MKNIVLCSDGTGNKGGYGEDTNVYKMYKAVNIHDAKAKDGSFIQQLTFYDQGVGTDKSDTNKNKYLTALSGAFGFGFEANVRHLYHYLARSYNTGDAIFLFGFSRGAATVRAFNGFITTCGLLDRNNPAMQSKDTSGKHVFDENKCRDMVSKAFKCYQARLDHPEQAIEFKKQYAVKDAEHAPDGNIKIKFIGVWDTVSALGFPQDFSKTIEWLFKAADGMSDKIWPHSFYDYELSPNVETAYHAISIDDERKTFRPLVWDENKTTGHVEQVWFPGVHSNVGGGYPRTGLSDTALVWMITKAEAQGLVLYEESKQQIQDSANIYDKLYDSRDGVALYYRYNPRNIDELCLNDNSNAAASDAKPKPKLKGNITLHDSAYKKIKDISDAYAPTGLPDSFDVVTTASSTPIKTITAWKDTSLEKTINTYIQYLEYLYRAFVELTMLILVVAGIFWVNPPAAVISPEACTTAGIMGKLAGLLKYLTPTYFDNFITYVVCVHPSIFFIMAITLYAMRQLDKTLKNKLDTDCRKLCDLLP